MKVLGKLNRNGVDQPGAPATTLPSSPYDTQQAILVDSTSAPTYAWLMMWSAAASKWIFLGGSKLFAAVDTSENTTSSSYTDLATVGPSITVPYAGVYELSYGAVISSANGGSPGVSYYSPKLGSSTPLDTDALQIPQSGAFNGDVQANITLSRKFNLTAGEVIKMQARSTGVAQPVYLRWLEATPVAVTT